MNIWGMPRVHNIIDILSFIKTIVTIVAKTSKNDFKLYLLEIIECLNNSLSMTQENPKYDDDKDITEVNREIDEGLGRVCRLCGGTNWLNEAKTVSCVFCCK